MAGTGPAFHPKRDAQAGKPTCSAAAMQWRLAHTKEPHMNRTINAVFAAIALVAPLAGFAQPGVDRIGDDRFKAVQAGESQQDVRAQLGAPMSSRSSTNVGMHGAAQWTYRYTDTWGMPARFDVTFDASGRVSGTSELRTLY
jgi:hypothetical protein